MAFFFVFANFNLMDDGGISPKNIIFTSKLKTKSYGI